MFLNIKTLLRLMKTAYKGFGLNVQRFDDTLYLGASGWEAEMPYQDAPKEIKAKIVELAGELPEDGTAATLMAAGGQMDFPVRTIGPLTTKDKKKAFRTDIRIRDMYVLQLETERNRPVMLVKEPLITMAEGEPDYNRGETGVSGPYVDDNGIYYWTNTTKLHLLPCLMPSRQELLDTLGTMELMGEPE